jgi:hypothetical protein
VLQQALSPGVGLGARLVQVTVARIQAQRLDQQRERLLVAPQVEQRRGVGVQHRAAIG